MSMEYLVCFPDKVPGELIKQILGKIAKYPGYGVVSSSEATVALRSLANEQRDTWPEDIVVNIDETKLALVIYSATRQERETFIAFINNVLRMHGISVKLEEL
jgi:hypothetical protein